MTSYYFDIRLQGKDMRRCRALVYPKQGEMLPGLTASHAFNLPAGAAMVLAFAVTFVAAVVLSTFISVTTRERGCRLRRFFRGISASFLVTLSGAVIVAHGHAARRPADA